MRDIFTRPFLSPNASRAGREKDGIAAIVTITPYTYMLARSTLNRNLGEGLTPRTREMLLPLFTELREAFFSKTQAKRGASPWVSGGTKCGKIRTISCLRVNK